MLAHRRGLQAIFPASFLLVKAAVCGSDAPLGSLVNSDWCRKQLAGPQTASVCRSSSAVPDSERPGPPQYSKSGRITGIYSVQRLPVFAVVELGPTQFKVSAGDVVHAEKLAGVGVNDKVSLNRVLLLGTRFETVIGRPFVPGATVTAAVEEQTLDAKVLIFHKRRRKNSKKMKGHRQPLTTLRILEVKGIEAQGPAATESEPEAALAA